MKYFSVKMIYLLQDAIQILRIMLCLLVWLKHFMMNFQSWLQPGELPLLHSVQLYQVLKNSELGKTTKGVLCFVMLSHTWVQKLLWYLDNRDVYKKIELGKARARHKKCHHDFLHHWRKYVIAETKMKNLPPVDVFNIKDPELWRFYL